MGVFVTINCITYNHEKYIAQAIEGFLMQITDFEYEVLIHDDASTDRTAAVIGEYTRQYPDIIKPIYQTENQYSKGLKISYTYTLPRAQGKYIAVCEGDDFWTDPLKLQKQFDYMEENPDCSMCFHAVEVVNKHGVPKGRPIKPYNENCIVPIEDVIVGGGEFFRANSIFFRKECIGTPPDFYLQAPVGDLPMVLYLASKGTVYYINEVMSAYRSGVEGSWTSSLAQSNRMQIEARTQLIEMTNEFNIYTDYEYADSVELRKNKLEFLLLVAQGNVTALKEPRYKRYYEQLGKYSVARLYFNNYFPRLYSQLRQCKKNIITKISHWGK